MIKQKSIIVFLMLLVCSPLFGINKVIHLKTENMDDVIGISSFVLNSKEEIFLFSSRLSRIFKFKPDGSFEKSFCQRGEGPGEVFRVFSMFHNPVNDFLYLPEYYSMSKGKVTIYDRNGKYKGLLEPEISREYMDRIAKIIFLKHGTYLLVTKKRVGWKPIGKLFKTQDEVWIRYFNQSGKLVSDIFKTKVDDELSNAVRYGGPQILFKPSILINSTPDDHIAISNTDENIISIYDKSGKKVNTITLEIPREKLTDQEFNEAKKDLIERYERREPGSRMHFLAKNMIKLEYKSIYWNQFLTPQYIILEKTDSRDEDGYVKTSKLIFFDWNGEKKGEKIIKGYVKNIQKDKGLIKYYDEDSNEHFRIEPNIYNFVKDNKKLRGQSLMMRDSGSPVGV